MKRQFSSFFFRDPGAGGGGGGATEQEQLLTKIKTQVAEQTRGLQNAEQVNALINKAFEGLSLEAMRSFKFEDVTKSVQNMAAEIEKLRNAPVGGGGVKVSTVIKDLVERSWNKITEVFHSREQGREVVLNTRAAVTMTTENVLDDSEVPQDILESFSTAAFVKKRRPKQYVNALATRRTVAAIDKYKTWLEEGANDGAFAIVAEGAVKPLMSTELVRNVATYKKAAGKYVITEELAKFKKNILNIIEDVINDKVMREYDQLVTADVVAAAADYVGSALDGQYAAPTDYHAIGAVAAQIESLDFIPDTLILNPQDKWRIGLEQNSQGSFFVQIPQWNPDGQVTMLGFIVLTSNYITAGEFILAESGLFKIEEEALQMRMGYGITVTKDGDGKVTDVKHDLDTNQMRMIIELFFIDWLASNHVGSIVKANFADVKAALQSVPAEV